MPIRLPTWIAAIPITARHGQRSSAVGRATAPLRGGTEWRSRRPLSAPNSRRTTPRVVDQCLRTRGRHRDLADPDLVNPESRGKALECSLRSRLCGRPHLSGPAWNPTGLPIEVDHLPFPLPAAHFTFWFEQASACGACRSRPGMPIWTGMPQRAALTKADWSKVFWRTHSTDKA